MGRKRDSNHQHPPSPPQPSARTSTEQPETTEYVIGGGQYDDLCIFWSRQLSRVDQVDIVSVSEESLRTEFALHSIEVTNVSSESSIATMAKITKFFAHALEARNGKFEMKELETEFPNDVAFAWILVGLLEKRLVEYRQIGSIWVQTFWSLICCLWIKNVSWTILLLIVGILLVSFFSSIHVIIPLRRWIYLNVFSFFNPQLIPASISPLLLFGPGILIALNRESEWTCSIWPLILAVPPLICALATNIVSSPSRVRTVYKLSIASILMFNIVFVLYVTFGISYWYGLWIGLIFNWNFSSALMGMLILGFVIAGAFLRDVISACRRKPNIQTLCLVISPVFAGYMYMKWSHMGMIKTCLATIALIAFVTIGVPPPSARLIGLLSRVGVLAIDVFQLVVVTIQTVTATCIIFSNSPKIGVEWVKYLCRSFSVRSVNPEQEGDDSDR